MTTMPRVLRRPQVSEAGFQDTVADLLRLHKFLVFHARPARAGGSWRTPVSYDGAGFPDLVAIGRGRLIAIEVKTDKGKLTSEQIKWAERLCEVSEGTGLVTYWCLRPAGWDNFVTWVRSL